MTIDRQEVVDEILEILRQYENRDPLVTVVTAEALREKTAEQILRSIENSDYISFINN